MHWEKFRKNVRNLSFKRISYFVCLLTPFLLLPLAIGTGKEAKCAYIILWMAVYWMLEPVHLTVTALLPIVLLPLFGILNSQVVCANYMREVLMMFFGGLAVAAAVEHCRLHERIALKVLMLLGTDTKWLMLGFMLTTMFLSMWISNTATTAMMVPIVDAVLKALRESKEKDGYDEAENDPAGQNSQGKKLDIDVLHTTLLLSVSYSANCGGTGTITGTSPNMVFKGLLEELYPRSNEITFATWMGYNVPGMLCCVLTGWLILQVLYFPCWRSQDKNTQENIRRVIVERYKSLGKINFHQMAVLVLFIILVLLWTFRDPRFTTGWASLVSTEVHIGDAVPVICILCLLFLLPAEPWNLGNSKPLLEWSVVQRKVPWGLIFLLGGGFALAEATKESGLSKWLGERMISLSHLSPSLVLFTLCVSTAILTEVISNSTVATILLPVVSQMALAFRVNPLYWMLPVTIASSYAFMLPVATGPNAIVFESGRMKTIDMVKPGILMNIVSCGLQLMMINTLGVYMFDLGNFPAWANSSASFEIAVGELQQFLNTTQGIS